MATIHKLTKDGSTIFPATITDAVVHPNTGKTLTSMIKDYNVSELFPTEGVDGGNKYNLALAIQVLGVHLTAEEKSGGIKLTFISTVLGNPSEEYYLNSSNWSTEVSDWGQRFEVGGVVADPSGSWEPSSAQEYIDEQVGEMTAELTSEIVARQTGDSNLQTQIDSVVERVDDAAFIGDRMGSETLNTDFDPETDTVWNKPQILSASQKTQVKQNLGIDTELQLLHNQYTALTQSNIVVGELPAAGSGQINTIYRVPGTNSYSDYMYATQGGTEILMATYNNGIDTVPTPNSTNIVESNAVAVHGNALDISELNKNGSTLATYASLSEALATVPTTYQKGGMSIKFIQLTPATYSVVKTEGVTTQPTSGTETQEALSINTGIYTADQLGGITLPATWATVTYYLAVTVDNVTTYTTWVITYENTSKQEYVQYKLINYNWSNNIAYWQGTDEIPLEGSNNFVKSVGVFKFGLATDGKDISSSLGRFGNGGYASFATFDLDTSGHNGTWTLLKASGAAQRIRIDCNNLIDGEVYRIRFNFVTSNGFPLSVIGIGKTKTSDSWISLEDINGNSVYTKNGIIDFTFVKSFRYLLIAHNAGNLTFPMTATVSNFVCERYYPLNKINEETDDIPTKNSFKFVKSGGVFSSIGGINISEINKNGSTLATYTSLSEALAAVPAAYQEGGVNIKFILRTTIGIEDNPVYKDEYVQYKLMRGDWSTSSLYWQKVDEEVYPWSDNPVSSAAVYKAITGTDYVNPCPWQTHSTAEGAGPATTVDEDGNVFIPISWIGSGRRIQIDVSSLTVGVDYIFEFDWLKQGDTTCYYMSTGNFLAGPGSSPSAYNTTTVKNGGHVIIVARRPSSTYKYISFATQSMTYISAGDTMIVANYKIYIKPSNTLPERLNTIEQGINDSVKFTAQNYKTDSEKNMARANIDTIHIIDNVIGLDNNLSYYDNILINADINSNNIIVSGDSRIGYKQVKKGDIITVRGNSDNGGTSTSSNIYLCYSEEKPVMGSEVIPQIKKTIDAGIAEVFIEWIAPADGWLCVRYFPRGSNFVLPYVKSNISKFLNKYIPEKKVLFLTTSKVIDANPDSETYGQPKSTSVSFGISDFIDLEGVAYIELIARASTSTYILEPAGSVYYNADYEPIGIADIISYHYRAWTAWSVIAVPAEAKYIRFTQYVLTENVVYLYRKTSTDLVEHDNTNTPYLVEFRKNLIFNNDCKVSSTTIIPSASQTYNAYYRNSHETNFRTGGEYLKRLTYYPEYFVKGGELVTINYTGRNGIVVFELPYRELGTSPVNAFLTTEIIKSTSFPSNTSTSYTGVATFRLSNSCRRIAIVLGSTTAVPISPSEITDEITSITLPVCETDNLDIPSNDDVATIAKEGIVEARIAQAKYVHSDPTIQSLGLVHFSDIHGDQISADAISKFISQNSEYITDVLCTGDSVHYYADATSGYPQGSVWWKETSNLADKSLFVLGNHDSATPASTEYDQKEDSAAWDGKGKDWCFTTYIEPYIETLGYVMPNGYNDSTSPNYHACYWHKDYAAQKIRVIGLDCLHRFDGILNPATGEITTAGVKWTTNEQELWLIEKLNETLDSTNAAYGYSVIVACHYPIDNFSGNNEEWNDTTHKFVYNQNAAGGRVMDFKTGDVVGFHYGNTTSYSAVVKFNMNNRVDNGYSQGEPYPNYTQGSTNNVANIIKTWMDSGGKFVVWLCGHTHVDYMWYPTKYPNILCVVLDQAGCLRGTNTGNRSTNLDSRVCANYYSIDTQNGLFKIVRIGYTMNKLMNSHEYLCYDYINRKVLNEG